MESIGYINNSEYINKSEYMDNSMIIEEQNQSCYRFEKINFNNNVLLDIDATYVIHLENNGRLDSVKAQLNEFRPTREVFILHNKGYKKCKKEEYINKAPLDLVDAYLYIFKDAQEKDYKHVLILEDDFIFNDKIKNKTVQQNIMNFINNRNYDIYALGILPFLQKAYNSNVSISLLGSGTHAIIYSRECINKTLQKDKKSIQDWDFYIGTTFRKYMYNEPLCYQLFPETENQDYWPNILGIKYITLYIMKLLKLDVQVEPGYSTMYIASKGLYGLCIILLVWFFISVFKI
jgi:predicted nucleic acid-binding protein